MTRRYLAVALIAMAVVQLAAPQALAVLVQVTPSNLAGWSIDTYFTGGDPNYSGTFVTGPATPPEGTGSVRLTVGADGGGAVKLHTNNFNGTLLSAISKLQYSTYVTTNSGGTPQDDQQAPYVQIPVDWDNDGVYDDRLFFEPVYQTGTYSLVPGAGAIPDQRGGDGSAPKVGIWETYDILAGGFWTENLGAGGPPLDTIANYLSVYPNAKIVNSATAGGLQFVAGFGGPGDWGSFDGNVDAIVFETASSSVTYDFEVAAVPEASAMLFGGLACCASGIAYGVRRCRGRKA